ncbi:LPXTG cell wall anchor domain-containing protein [Enterococcus cecorum]|uniref:mucin-binding protein n=1 Tax=Enterococcus cecorum TaxID=44008 RepID=UPI001FAC98DD|nr:LPXTG cell wall anchor domain-containing protein [Enterococcus cecorum]MCJ0594873.1 LPXTG cell wall anchor domain-containing protein [Enterococcus cecorum]
MFRNKTGDRQYKYSLRKIRGGGGAASFIIGAVIFGGLMTQPVVLADSTTDTTTSDATTQPENISPTETVATEAASTTATIEETPTVTSETTAVTPKSATDSAAETTATPAPSVAENTENSANNSTDTIPVEKVGEEKVADETTEDSTKKEKETTAPTRVRRSLSVPDEVDNTGKVISPGFDEKNVVTISRPVDYPNLPTYRDYNPNDYYIFKEVVDKTLGLNIYAAVKIGDSSKTIYLFNQYGSLLKALAPNTSATQNNVKINNYGSTYTIAQISGSGNLFYGYSSDGEKDVVEKNQSFNSITGVIPEKSEVTVEYVDQDGKALLPKISKDALSGEIRNIIPAPAIEGYVLKDNTGYRVGEVSIYTAEKVGKKWTRHFGVGYTGYQVDAVYTLLDTEGTFLVQMYKNNQLFVEYTIAPGESFTKTIYSDKYYGTASDTYTFPNPYIPNSGGLVYHYERVGKIIPVDQDNIPIPDAPTPSYHTDPNNPKEVLPDQPTPDIPGYEKTVDKITPDDPTEDTYVRYLKNGMIVVEYFDRTTNTRLFTTGDAITGRYGDIIDYSANSKIAEYQNKGYKLVANHYTEYGKVFSKYNDQKVYKIIFEHDTVTYTPDDPGNPDTPFNPKDPDPDKPKVPKEAAYENLVKSATQTITYEVQGGNAKAPETNVTTVDRAFTRTVTYDKVTGKKISETPWTPERHQFDKVKTPDLQYYTADKAEAGGLTATVANPNVADHVIYTPIKGSLSVRYLDKDKNNQEIADTRGNDSGNYGEAITYSTAETIANLIKKGFELVSDGFTGKAGSIFDDSNNNHIYDVVLKHGITEYTPENPGTPDTPINPEDPDGPKVPGDAARENLAKDASQTVHYTGAGENTPADNVINVKDAFTRSIKVDKVTGEIIERKDWTPNEHAFETVATPEVVNYYADKAQAGGLTATVENPNVVDNVVYAPKEGSLTVRYLDQDKDMAEIEGTRGEDSGNYGNPITYSTTETITNLIKKGFELVSDGFTGKVGEVFGDNNKGQTYDVVLKHGITEYTPENPGNPDTPINPEDPDGPKVPEDAARENLAKDASQTVHYTGAGANTPADHVINVKDAFTRSIKVDKVTGEIIERKDWTPNEHAFEIVTTPEVVNYYADKDQAGGLTATVENPNVVDNVVYAPKEASLTVRYLDQDKGMEEIEGTRGGVSGNYGNPITYSTAETIANLIKKGFELVSDGFTGKAGEVFGDDNKGQTYDVILKHGITEYTPENPGTPDTPINPENPNGPKVPGDAARENLAKDASQTVHYTGAGENTPADNVINVKDAFTRSIKVDKVTGTIIERKDWTPNEHAFETVATPEVVNYYADKDQAGGLTATVENPNVVDNVVYVPKEGTLTVRYLDQDKGMEEIEGTGSSIGGNYGDTINYSTQPTIDELIKKGYELVSDGFTESGKTFGDDNKGQTYDVVLKHGITEYTPENPGTPDTPINPEDPDGPKVPGDAARENLAKDASQTIHYTGAGENTPADNVINVKDAFTRSIKVDKVTGEIIERKDWAPNEHAFETVATPEVVNYYADKAQAGGLTATVENPNAVDNVVYAPKEGSLTVRYLDQDKGVEEIEGTGSSIGGNYGDTINYSTQPTIDELLKKGYELVSDGFTESGKTFGDDNKGQTYDVVLKHVVTEYTPENPGTPDTPINPEDPDGPKVPEEAARENLAKDASQTIHYIGAGENTPADNVITAKDAFTRSIKVDKVTGKILSETKWYPKNHPFDKVATPAVVYYLPDKVEAGGLIATVDNPNVIDQVVYVSQEGALTIRYLDLNNGLKVIPGTGGSVNGKYGERITYTTQPTIDGLVKKGYELIIDGFTGHAGETFNDENKGKTYDVILKHGVDEYTPDKPGTPGTPINPDDPHGPKVPEDAARENLAKDASQTIYYSGAGDKTPANHVTYVKDAFTRSIKVDKVTGEIVERTEWQPGKHVFDKVVTPEIAKYTADKVQAGGLVATVENPDVVDHVDYVQNSVPTPPRLPNTGGNPTPQPQPQPMPQQVVQETPRRSSRHLPKTGSKANTTAAGLATVSMAGLLGLISKRRRKED